MAGSTITTTRTIPTLRRCGGDNFGDLGSFDFSGLCDFDPNANTTTTTTNLTPASTIRGQTKMVSKTIPIPMIQQTVVKVVTLYISLLFYVAGIIFTTIISALLFDHH
jgi:hypothetical protein